MITKNLKNFKLKLSKDGLESIKRARLNESFIYFHSKLKYKFYIVFDFEDVSMAKLFFVKYSALNSSYLLISKSLMSLPHAAEVKTTLTFN